MSGRTSPFPIGKCHCR